MNLDEPDILGLVEEKIEEIDWDPSFKFCPMTARKFAMQIISDSKKICQK